MQTENEQLILKKAKTAEYNKRYYIKNKEKASNYYYNNKEKIAEYQKNNKEKLVAAKKKYRQNNKEKVANYKKEYRQNNKSKTIEYSKKYTENNKEKIAEYRKENKEKNKEYFKNYYQKNKEKIKQYLVINKIDIREKDNKRRFNKRNLEPLYKLKENLRSRMHHAFKNKNFIKSQRTLEMLGCDLETIKSHLEKQFTKEMNWSNQGKWHIDHIIPCASAKTEEELIKLFHYTNLQPLWAADNLSKSDKIVEKQLFLL